MAFHTSPATASDLASSPAGTVMSLTAKPAAFSDALAASRYSGPTFVSVMTSSRGAVATAGRFLSEGPSPSSTAAPMRTS